MREDKVFKNIAKKHKIDIFFGNNLNVLKRMNDAIKIKNVILHCE